MLYGTCVELQSGMYAAICHNREMDPLWSLAKFQLLPESLVCTAHVVHQRSGYLFPFMHPPAMSEQMCMILQHGLDLICESASVAWLLIT